MFELHHELISQRMIADCEAALKWTAVCNIFKRTLILSFERDCIQNIPSLFARRSTCFESYVYFKVYYNTICASFALCPKKREIRKDITFAFHPRERGLKRLLAVVLLKSRYTSESVKHKCDHSNDAYNAVNEPKNIHQHKETKQNEAPDKV